MHIFLENVDCVLISADIIRTYMDVESIMILAAGSFEDSSKSMDITFTTNQKEI